MNNNFHIPVMLTEVITAMNIKKDGLYIDATFGRGGHSFVIADKITTGSVLAFDKDIDAITYGKNNIKHNIELLHSDFTDIYHIIKQKQLLGKIDGILLDLGLSSPQLDNARRGFSFQNDGPLDMRMDTTKGVTASEWLFAADEKEIANILYKYGDEKKSRIIAKRIKEYGQINSTKELANIIKKIIPKTSHKHPATRSFQAIRIHINNELKALEVILNHSIEILAINGILAVISFHSIEDRIVKNFIKKHSKANIVNKYLPPTNNNTQLTLKNLGKKKANREELLVNIRSRSAMLRLAQKC